MQLEIGTIIMRTYTGEYAIVTGLLEYERISIHLIKGGTRYKVGENAQLCIQSHLSTNKRQRAWEIVCK
jgi:hypothetical protein